MERKDSQTQKGFIAGLASFSNATNQTTTNSEHEANNNNSTTTTNTNNTNGDDHSQQQPKQQGFFHAKHPKPSTSNSNNAKQKLTEEEIKRRREQFKQMLTKVNNDDDQADSQLVLGLSEPIARIQLVLPDSIPSKSNDARRSFDFEFPTRFTVDQVKGAIWKAIPALGGINKKAYVMGLDENNKFSVEFARFSKCHKSVKKAIKSEERLKIFLIPATGSATLPLNPNQRKPKVSLFDEPTPTPTQTTQPTQPSPSQHASQIQSKPTTPTPTPTTSAQSSSGQIPSNPNQPNTTTTTPTPTPTPSTTTATGNSLLLSNSKTTTPRSSSTFIQASPHGSFINLGAPAPVTLMTDNNNNTNTLNNSNNNDANKRVSLPPPTTQPEPNTPNTATESSSGSNSTIEKSSSNASTTKEIVLESEGWIVFNEKNQKERFELSWQIHSKALENQELGKANRQHKVARVAEKKLSARPWPQECKLFGDSNTVIDLEKDENYYQQVFFEHGHTNWVLKEGEAAPLVLSIMKQSRSSAKNSAQSNTNSSGFPAIIWTSTGIEKIVIPASLLAKGQALLPSALGSKEKLNALRSLKPNLKLNSLTRVKDVDFANELFKFEKQQKVKSYKFGVLFVKDGQTDEDQMFSNAASPEFDKFLEVLGEKVVLKGWNRYRGGLDVKADSTGTHSVYNKLDNFEIMFHVSTLLPFNAQDKQQLERKRHLGNDIVIVIFVDKNSSFSAEWIASEFIHVYIVVREVEGGYTVNVVQKTEVPPFGPPIQPLYTSTAQLRSFLLTKLINAERASYYAPAFSIKAERTRIALMNELIKKV